MSKAREYLAGLAVGAKVGVEADGLDVLQPVPHLDGGVVSLLDGGLTTLPVLTLLDVVASEDKSDGFLEARRREAGVSMVRRTTTTSYRRVTKKATEGVIGIKRRSVRVEGPHETQQGVTRMNSFSVTTLV